MRIRQHLLTLLPFFLSTYATYAPVVNNNPAGVQYVAVLPDKNDTTIRGTVQISSAPNGTGVNVQISINGMVVSGGPYAYSIHQNQAPALNCGAAGGRFDPYNVTDSFTCDPSQPDKCQVGDLGGKHGTMNGTSYSANYIDSYLSTQPGTPAFFGNRSVVVQFANGTLVSCANFTMSGTGSATSDKPVVVSTITVTANVATATPPVVNMNTPSTPALGTTTLTVLRGSQPVLLTTQFVTAYTTVPIAASSSSVIASQPNSTVLNTTSPSVVQSSQTPQTQLIGPTLTTTSTVISMVVVIPPQQSTQIVSSQVTLTQSSNVTLVSAMVQPYTIIGTSTILATLVQPSAQTLTVPTSIIQTTLLPGITQGGQVPTVATPLVVVQTVYTTMISTITLTAGATMPTAMTVTAYPSMPSGSTVTMTSTSGNWVATISTFLFGAPRTTVPAPTTVTVTAGQSLLPSVISQVVQLVSLTPVPGVATVLNIVSVAPGATSVIGKTLTSVIVTPPIVTNVVSVVTANGVVSTIVPSIVTNVVSVVTAPGLTISTIVPSIVTNAMSVVTAPGRVTTIVPSIVTIATALLLDRYTFSHHKCGVCGYRSRPHQHNYEADYALSLTRDNGDQHHQCCTTDCNQHQSAGQDHNDPNLDQNCCWQDNYYHDEH
ncbi:hypothetical protein AMS68_007223 [Peltaster fructicola]|uniref:Superoxide dismutase copper/zinc binding domain-containing protein n=1 Tax=Peltaster fructicola TaxID=286661 RepID=A0A6H0Y421_9PEZI|nr:hypothetical protein AMS68_007223 [Peltaster fructicola]